MTVFFRTTMHHNSLVNGGLYLGAKFHYPSMKIFFRGPNWDVLNSLNDLQMPSAVCGIFLSARVVDSSFLCDGILGPQHDRGQYFWIICNAVCHGFRRIYTPTRLILEILCLCIQLYLVHAPKRLLLWQSIPAWWIWGSWFSPLMYAQNAASLNEFLGHSWDKVM